MAVQLTVYFNGACSICAPEVALYRRRTEAHGRAHVSYYDISTADLPADLPAGTLRDDLLRRLHIQKDDVWYSGVDAFLQLCGRGSGF